MAVTFGLMAYAGNMVWSALEASWSEEPRQRPQRERVFAANVVTVTPETIRPVLSTFGELRARRSGRASSASERRATTCSASAWCWPRASAPAAGAAW